MNQGIRIALLFACAFSLFTPQGRAGTIYSTGFEAPTFSTVGINGQDGWIAGGTAIVESGIQSAGTQAMGIVGDSSGPRALRITPVDTTVQNVVILSADFAWSDLASGWSFLGVGGAFNTLGGFTVLPDGSLQFATAGSPTTGPLISTGSFVNLSVLYDFSGGAFSVFLNGAPVGGGMPFLDSTDTQFLAGLYANDNGNGGVLFTDNYSVVATNAAPEPGSFLLGLAGCALLAGFARGRRA